MKETTSSNNTTKNEKHYDHLYKQVNIESILRKIYNFESFFSEKTKTDTSWVGFYYNNFANELKGKKVLELGCGDCTNAAVMSVLGAEVYANDISQVSGEIVDKLNKSYDFKFPIQFVQGDFLKSNLPSNYFDIVVGKAFIHHLTHDQEEEFTKIIVRILKKDGVVRYFEPAVNSKLLDKLRWIIPVPGRPSIFQRDKFAEWKKNDPHPDRDNSSVHYKSIGEKYFGITKIIPIGAIERFHRILPSGNLNRKFRRLAFKLEKYIPNSINLALCRSQVIIYKNPKNFVESENH